MNSETVSHLRGLEAEFGESSNAIRVELNRLAEAGLLSSMLAGNKKMYAANKKHPLFEDIHRLLLKYTGLDQIIDQVIARLGNVERVYLVGSLSKGKDSELIELMIIGNVNEEYLKKLVHKVKSMVNREIKYLMLLPDSLRMAPADLIPPHALLLWKNPDN